MISGRLMLLVAAFALSAGYAAEASAQTDFSGVWDVSVVTDANPEPSMLTLDLAQAGDSISGEYNSQTFGIAPARGSVSGGELTVRVDVSDPTGQLGGGPLGTVVMIGTLSDPTSISGSYALNSDFFPLAGTFEGTKRAADGGGGG